MGKYTLNHSFAGFSKLMDPLDLFVEGKSLAGGNVPWLRCAIFAIFLSQPR